MPKARTRKKTAATRSARSRRAQARQIADLFAPLTDDQMIEAEGYLIGAYERKVAQLEAEVVELGAKRAALPSPAPLHSAAFVEANTIDDELAHIGDALAELEHVLDSVRNRRQFSTSPALAIMVIKSGSRGLVAEAQRLGVEPDADALAEHLRRENLISGWLMQFEGAPEAGPDAGLEAVPDLRALPPARP